MTMKLWKRFSRTFFNEVFFTLYDCPGLFSSFMTVGFVMCVHTIHQSVEAALLLSRHIRGGGSNFQAGNSEGQSDSD